MRTRTGARKPEPETRSPERRPREEPKSKSTIDQLRVPHDPINETVVIAAVITDESARRAALEQLSVDHFFGRGHAEIWLGLQELERRKLSYDPATLRTVAPGIDQEYLDEILRQRGAAPPNFRHHIEQLKFDRARIELARGPVQELLEAIRDPRVTAERLRSIADRMGSGLAGHGSERSLRQGTAVAREQMTRIVQRLNGFACRPFGIPGLDRFEEGHEREGAARLLPGTVPGQVTVVTGLSGSGKSTSLANAILGMFQDGRRLLLGAWEQGSGMTLEILATISLGLSRRDVVEGRLSDRDLDDLETEMERLGGSVQFFELEFGKSRGKVNDQQLDKIQQVVVDSGCDVFVADLFRRALKETDPDDEEQALYRMQDMAQKTKAHFILVQQQRLKDVEQRKDKRPTREGIKGSGAWTEIADTILGWHRPAQWKAIPDDKIEALVLKQRYGEWPLIVELDWEPEFGRIGAGRTVQFEQQFDDDSDPLLDGFVSRGKSKR